MKIRIAKAPTLPKYSGSTGTGKKRTGDQENFALFTNTSASVNDVDSKEVPGTEDIRAMYPEVEREKANVEVEQGEIVVSPDLGTIYKVGGKKHSRGGTPIKAKEGSYVISDFIKTNSEVMEALNFDYDKKKDKKQTWADVLKDKVDPKYYNQLAATIADNDKKKDVDPYLLNTAQIKLPEYAEIISKVALGNEISKAMAGKEFKIPAVAQIGIAAMKIPTPTEDDAPMLEEAKYGGLMQFAFGDEVVEPYLKSNTPAGAITPTGLNNFYNRGKEYLKLWEHRIPGITELDNKAAQSRIYDYMLRHNPQAVEAMWSKYGITNQGKASPELMKMTQNGKFNGRIGRDQLASLKKAYVDGMFGARQLTPDINPTIQTDRTPLKPGSPTSIPVTPRNFPFPIPPTPVDKPIQPGQPNVPIQFDKATPQKLGYDWRNIRDVLDSMHQDPTRYPWSAKSTPYTVNPQFDDPNYYPMLAANRQRNDMLAQISNPNIARGVSSYNPDLVYGFTQETQRARGNNLQAVTQSDQYNAGVMNQYGAQEAARQTRDYDNTIKTLDNRDTARSLRRANISGAVNNAEHNRDQMRFLLAQNPQYTISNPWNYSSDVAFLQGKSLSDPGSQGATPIDQFKQIQEAFKNFTPDQQIDIFQTLFNKQDNTKVTRAGYNPIPVKTVDTNYH